MQYLEKNDFVFVGKLLELGYFFDKLDDELDGEDAVYQHLVVVLFLFSPALDLVTQLVLSNM